MQAISCCLFSLGLQWMLILNQSDRSEILSLHSTKIPITLMYLMSHVMNTTLRSVWSQCSVCYVAFVAICIWSVLSFPPFLRFGHSARMAAARAATPGRHPGHTAGRCDQGLPTARAGPGGGVPIHWPGGRWARTAFPIRHLLLLGFSALLACSATTTCQQNWQPGRAAQRKWRDPWSGARPNGGWRRRGLFWWGTLITSLTLWTGLGVWDHKASL